MSVEIAIWNRGHTPAVISGGYLLFDACQDLREGQAAYVLAEPAAPFVIPPGEVVLRTVEAYVTLSFASGQTSTSGVNSGNGKSEYELVLGSDCGASSQAPKRAYIGVGLEAVQSDGKVENSSGIGGLLQRRLPASGLNLNDKYGTIGGTALSHAILWDGQVPEYIAPFSVIPARHTPSARD